MPFIRQEDALRHLAFTVGAGATTNIATDEGKVAVYRVCMELRAGIPEGVLLASEHLYAALAARYLEIYEHHGYDKVKATGELCRECVFVLGEVFAENLVTEFLTRFFADRRPAKVVCAELDRYNAEVVRTMQARIEIERQNERKTATLPFALRKPPQFEGTASVLVPCPQCDEKKRCDANTKRYRCKKCGFDEPFNLREYERAICKPAPA